MRTKGYKCYNIKCGACVGKTLCGLSGDEALTCDSRMVNQKTNADRIRAMSDEELAELLVNGRHTFRCADCDAYVCDDECEKNCLKWLQQPVKEDA